MLRAAALTTSGRCRDFNEDTFTLLDLATGWSAPEGGSPVSLRSHAAVLAVYDGTDECAPGRSTSHVAARIVAERLSTVRAGATGEELSRRLLDAVQAAHREVFAIRSANRRNTGTTATVAAISAEQVSIAHIGDSRAYLFAQGALRQITQDDTLVRELLAEGKLRPDEIESFPHKTVITRVLGFTEEVDVPVMTSLLLQAGDVLLLCSDGVTDMVGDPELAAILGAHRDPAAACRALIEAADEAGGHDNETAVVALFEPR
jgi:PPM family protein phosphatase